MEYTKNLKLSKPSYDDDVDIQIINTNMDMLDDNISKLDYVKNVQTDDNGLTFTKKDNSQIQVPLNYLKLTGGNVTGDITVKDKPVISIEETITSDDGYCIKYSNGYMEQHYKIRPTTAQFFTLNFLAPFYDTNYIIGTCGEKQDIEEYGSFVDYVGETLGATQPNKVMTNASVTLSYHYAWEFGDMNKQKIMVNLWGRWR